MLDVKGNGLVDERAGSVTDITAKPEMVQTGLVVHKNSKTHPCIVDPIELRIEGSCGTGLKTGDPLAHLAAALPGHEVRRSGGHPVARTSKAKNMVWTVPDTLATSCAGSQKIPFP